MASDEIVLYVSPGDSRFMDSGASVFPTLQSAINSAREASAAAQSNPIRIVMKIGRHVAMDSVEFGSADGGSESAPLVIEGEGDRDSVITGGHRVEGDNHLVELCSFHLAVIRGAAWLKTNPRHVKKSLRNPQYENH